MHAPLPSAGDNEISLEELAHFLAHTRAVAARVASASGAAAPADLETTDAARDMATARQAFRRMGLGPHEGMGMEEFARFFIGELPMEAAC